MQFSFADGESAYERTICSVCSDNTKSQEELQPWEKIADNGEIIKKK